MPQEISHELNVNKIINPLANIIVAFSNDNIALNNIYTNISILSNSSLTNSSDLTNTLKSNGIIPPTFGIDNFNLSIKSNEVFSINTYKEFCSENNLNYQFAKANHFNINNKLLNITKTEPNPTEMPSVCTAVARVSVKGLQKFIDTACISPTAPKYKIFICPLAVALHQKYIEKSVETTIYIGCEYTLEVIQDKAINIYMKWKSDVNNSVKDMLLWLEFVNSIEGMMWLTNKINHI